MANSNPYPGSLNSFGGGVSADADGDGIPDALQAALNGQYAPLGDSETIVLTANNFEISSGSPALGPAPGNRQRAWLFDASTGERVQAMAWLPASWATVDITIVWANAGASGSGDNVAWRFYYDDAPAGFDFNGFWAAAASITNAAGTQWIAQYATSAGVAVPTGQLLTIAVDRNAVDAADTLAQDVAFYALILTKAS